VKNTFSIFEKSINSSLSTCPTESSESDEVSERPVMGAEPCMGTYFEDNIANRYLIWKNEWENPNIDQMEYLSIE
jgi:hypothetical protein